MPRNAAPLAKFRRGRGWARLDEFAARAGYSVQLLSDVERGKKRMSEGVRQAYLVLLQTTTEKLDELLPQQPLGRAHAFSRGPKRDRAAATITNQLAQWRLALDLKQEELAAKVGVSQRTLSRWELGKLYPGKTRIAPYAAALGVPEAAVRRAFALPAKTDCETFTFQAPKGWMQRLREIAHREHRDPAELLVEWAQDTMDIEDKYARRTA